MGAGHAEVARSERGERTSGLAELQIRPRRCGSSHKLYKNSGKHTRTFVYLHYLFWTIV